MGDVVRLKSEGPQIVGKARCLVCKHEWHAVAPVGTAYLECPKCTTHQGVMAGSVGADPAKDEAEWVCSCGCGCDVFKIVAHKDGRFKGVLCMRCGTGQSF
jgi:hypothetical protein